jgi:hypothetical protein
MNEYLIDIVQPVPDLSSWRPGARKTGIPEVARIIVSIVKSGKITEM